MCELIFVYSSMLSLACIVHYSQIVKTIEKENSLKVFFSVFDG